MSPNWKKVAKEIPNHQGINPGQIILRIKEIMVRIQQMSLSWKKVAKKLLNHQGVKAGQINPKIKQITARIWMSPSWKKVAKELLDHQVKGKSNSRFSFGTRIIISIPIQGFVRKKKKIGSFQEFCQS